MLMIIAGRIFELTQVDVSTCCTLLLMFVGIMMVARASKPLDRYKILVISACVAGLILCYTAIPAFFGMTRMTLQSWVICGVLAMFSIAVLRWMTKVVDFAWSQLSKSKLIQNIKI